MTSASKYELGGSIGSFSAAILLAASPWVAAKSEAAPHSSYIIDDAGSSAAQQQYSLDRPLSLGSFNQGQSDLQKTLAEISALRMLEDDWDSYGASRPSPVAIDLVENLVKRLKNFPVRAKTKVGSAGEVGLYWKSQNCYIDITVDAAKKFVIYHADSALNPVSYYEGQSYKEAQELLTNKATRFS